MGGIARLWFIARLINHVPGARQLEDKQCRDL
jgi:hypothetical protein